MTSDVPPNFRPDAFVGVAEDYLRYRPPYPAALLQSLLGQTATGAGRWALDLACGPGRLTLAIADRFEQVWAVDLEPEMIAVAQREATARGIANVRWSVGPAEAFAAPAGAFDLVTAGEAFHRLDQPLILRRLSDWLRPGGVFATMGGGGLLERHAPWRRVLAEVMREFIGAPAQRRDGGPAWTTADEEASFRAAGFVDVASFGFDMPCEWTLETVRGYLRSTSVASPHALGDRHAAFEAALTAAFLAHDPSGRYRETLRVGYTMARKP